MLKNDGGRIKMKKVVALLLCVLFCLALFAGCAGKSNDTIKVGILGCHTGEYAIYGLAVRNGAELYINKLNEQGGINGKKVELVIYDNKADNAEAVTAFTRMVDAGITALIGDVLTGNTLAVVAEAYPINMPMITASATAAEVTYDAETGTVKSNVFRTCFIDPFQGQKMAEYAANELKATSAAVLFDTGNDYSIGVKDAFVATCTELGIEVVNEEGYASGDVDFRSQLTNIQSKDPDVIFAPIYYQDAGLIVTQARDLGITSTFLGADGWAGVSGYASAEDLEGSLFCSAYAPGSTDAVKAFEAEYTAKYGADTLNMFAATAYDAAMVLCNALKIAEGSKAKPASDEYKQAVIDAIRDKSGDVVGITSAGGYTFDEHNNPIKDAVIIEVSNGAELFKTMY
jgi:branched-chain amino acid transport system substrate-binding protein